MSPLAQRGSRPAGGRHPREFVVCDAHHLQELHHAVRGVDGGELRVRGERDRGESGVWACR